MLAKAAATTASQSNKFVDIQLDLGSADAAYGAHVPAWVTVAARVPCKVSSQKGTRVDAFGKVVEQVTHQLTFASDPGVTNAHRVAFAAADGSTSYARVDYAINVEWQNQLFIVQATEFIT